MLGTKKQAKADLLEFKKIKNKNFKSLKKYIDFLRVKYAKDKKINIDNLSFNFGKYRGANVLKKTIENPAYTFWAYNNVNKFNKILKSDETILTVILRICINDINEKKENLVASCYL